MDVLSQSFGSLRRAHTHPYLCLLAHISGSDETPELATAFINDLRWGSLIPVVMLGSFVVHDH